MLPGGGRRQRVALRLTGALAAAALALPWAMVGTAPAASAQTTTQPVPGTVLLNSVACPTATTCEAVGYSGSSETEGVLVPITNGIPGAAQAVPGTLFLKGVACSGATTCEAVGQGSSGGVVVPVTNGTPGAAQAVAGTSVLDGVACPGAICEAVGLSSSQSEGVVVTFTTTDSTSTSVSCSPDPVVVGEVTTCTATVTDTSSSSNTPTGSVAFSSNGPGAFTGDPCTLSGTGASASCEVTYEATATGDQAITASYGGDATHATSAGTTALGVTVAPACTDTVSGSVNGYLTVPSGQVYCLSGARVNGRLNVSPGGALVANGSTVNGSLSSRGATFVRMCTTMVNGPTTVEDGTNAVVIGDAGDDGAPSCGANSLNGGVTLSSNNARVELGANHINGPVAVNDNTGSDLDNPSAGAEIEANRINGPLGCTANTPPPTNDNLKNTVNGPETGQCAGL